MADPPGGDVQGFVERFADRLQRLITLLGFFRSVSDDDTTPAYPDLPGYMSHVVRLAFEDADLAYWDLRMALPANWGIGRHGALFGGIEIYNMALSEPLGRWRVGIEPIHDEGSGTVRVGLVFPRFFMVRGPNRQVWIRPRELALMADALSLIKLGIDGQSPRPSEHAISIDCKYGPVILYGQDNPPMVLKVPKGTLNAKPYQVVKKLVMAGDAGCEWGKLEDVASSARRIVRTLRNDPDWCRVIKTPGTSWAGPVRIVDPTRDPG